VAFPSDRRTHHPPPFDARDPRSRRPTGRGAVWLAACVAVGSLVACSSASSAPDAGAAPSDGARPDSPDAAPPRSDAQPPDAAVPPLRVLFVGNSYTSSNDLPGAVVQLAAASPGPSIEVEGDLIGSSFLSSHTDVPGRLASGHFDAVVLQGQSAETLTDPFGFQTAASWLAGAARDAGTRPVWFATWSIHSDLGIGALEASRRIEAQYQLAARDNGGVVARVGAAWQIALAELPSVELYGGDLSHPTPAGTLLSACVIFQALTGQPPRVPDPAPLGIDQATAVALCALAPRVLCNEGAGICDGACVDLASNFARCGRCDVACPGMEPCQDGVCGCATGLTACDRRCVDTTSDLDNCGACGSPCLSGGVCTAGACACPAATAYTVRPADELSALRPDCMFPDPSLSSIEACNAAVHERCRQLDCFSSGFGPVPVPGHAYSSVCVSGSVQATTYTASSGFVAACDGTTERIGPDCSIAISRYCASLGLVTGYGPVESSGDDLTVTCVPRATIVHTTFASLGATVCDGVTSRWGPDCALAISFACARLGHLTGFGPIERAGPDVDIACVDP